MKNLKRIVSIILFISPCLFLSGCDAFKSWFDTTATTTVIGTQERANLTKLTLDLRTIQRSIEVFYGQNGRYPDSLEELTKKGTIHRVPREPFGGEWLYDPFTGNVKSSTHPDVVPE